MEGIQEPAQIFQERTKFGYCST